MTQASIIKKSVAITGIILIAALFYWGTIVPYEKSRRLVSALYATRSAGSAEELFAAINGSVRYRSPIGQEETVRMIVNTLSSILGSLGEKNAPVIVPLFVRYINDISLPLVSRGKGFGYTRLIFSMGEFYQAAWMKTRTPAFAARAETYYRQCLALSSHRPECLRGLLLLYADGGKKEEARVVASEIARFWPDDPSVTAILR
ncbi:MAG: hypothetical protein HYS43_00400 [Candidatus Liptonbacteria bacterium]|nr:hypothetical protein [Candidatus Liptonbacteria bacterium]